MARPLGEAADANMCLATVVDYAAQKVVFFDDGSETVQTVGALKEATRADRTAAKERYEEALRDANRIAAMDSEQVVEEAIETVRWLMGGTLGSDDMISYDASSKGDEAREGQLLVETLLAHFVSLAGVLPFKHWMATHWREVCEEADRDRSGTISAIEAVEIWDRVALSLASTIAAKLDALGAQARLYRGDLCMALPANTDDAKASLATYMDSTHVRFFDGSGEVEVARL